MPEKLSFDEYVLVTGGAGFIGSHVLEYFVINYPNFYFICVDKLNYVSGGTTKFILRIIEYPNFQFIKGDLAKTYSFIYDILVTRHNELKVNNIINLAAESSVDRSFTEPTHFFENNIRSIQNLLEACRILLSNDPRLRENFRFIHVSTDEVYGEQKDGYRIKEEGQLNPTNPYAASKAACDHIVQAYGRSYNIPYTIIRPNNIYGLRQFHEKIIPMTLSKLVVGYFNRKDYFALDDKIRIHGNGSNKRTYLHVYDFIKGLEIIWILFIKQQKSPMEKDFPIIGQVFNIGSENEMDNLSLVKFICDLFMERLSLPIIENYGNFIQFVKDRNFNDARYALDYLKMKNLNWCPNHDFKQGILTILDGMLLKYPTRHP